MENFYYSLKLMSMMKKLSKQNITLNHNKTVFELNEVNGKMKFLVDVNLNDKHIFCISLHSRLRNNRPIARIDFINSAHNNRKYNDEIPSVYESYIGVSIKEPHIHINFGENNIGMKYVIPLSHFKCCEVKNITSSAEIRGAILQYLTIMGTIANQIQIALPINFSEGEQ